MADNVRASASSNDGAIFATDEAAGAVHHPYVKLEFGADDTQTPVSTANPLPVDLGTNNDVVGGQADNAAVTTNPLLVGGRYDATPATRGDGDATAFQTNSTGHLYTVGTQIDNIGLNPNHCFAMVGRYNITPPTRGDDDACVLQTTNTGTLLVSDTAALSENAFTTVFGTSTIRTTLTDNFANPVVVRTGAFNMLYDGATWDFARGDATDGALVNLGTNNDVTVTGNAADHAAVSGSPVLMAGRYDITPATRDNGDVTTLQLNSVGELHVDIENATGVSGSAGPAKALSIAGTLATGELQEIQMSNATDGFDATTKGVYVFGPGMVYNGAQFDVLREGSETGSLKVDLGTNNDVTVTGTVTANAGTDLNTSALSTEATLSTLNGKVTACNTGAVVVSSGSITANAGTNLNTSALATSANITTPFGSSTIARAEDVASANAHVGFPAMVIRDDVLVAGADVSADGDYTWLRVGNNGALWVQQNVGTGSISTSQSVTTTTSTAATNFGAVASTHNYITSVTVYNSSATATRLSLQDGSGGTTRWVFPAPAGGGTTHNFNPPLKQTTANTALFFAAADAVTTLYVSINGYQAA